MIPRTKKELCIAYKISHVTLIKWLANVPNLEVTGNEKILNPYNLELIFKKYGNPYESEKSKNN